MILGGDAAVPGSAEDAVRRAAVDNAKGTIMRTLIARWMAIVAVLTGIGVAATALPAVAAPVAASTPSHARPADWWY